ncbi:hypothetical protein [Kribbella sp. NPDC050459]
MVGTASLHVVDGVGRLRSGATRPEYRGRGTQSALLTRSDGGGPLRDGCS